jgi:Threonine dehydrogenase and related Zn-dependent dehydrogenases
MLQAVVVGYKNVEIRHVPIPEINENEVLIKVKSIGICGSDIHVYNGVHLYNEYPIVQGHEVAGEIAQAGSRITDFNVGDKVTFQPQVVCEECYQCRHGNDHVCEDLKVLGFQVEGAASEYFAIDAGKVLKLPDHFSYDQGAMVEPLAVAVHAVDKLGDIRSKDILVLGAGPIGNLVAQVCKVCGAQSVMITDISDFRLDMAKACGIDCCVNVAEAELKAELYKRYGDKRADAIIECVGSEATFNQAIEVARKATDILIVGVLGSHASIDMGIVQDHELRIQGSLMYQRKDMKRAVSLISNGKLSIEKLVSKRFGFNEYNTAYRYIEDQKDRAMKIMITI